MFGYIKPDIPQLKVVDYELYKATYCGLCKTMGKKTGCLSNLTLSYDFAFLAFMRMALSDHKYETKMGRCISHPFKKRPMLSLNPSLEFSAKSSTILTRLKLKDNINDSHGLSKLKAKIKGIVSVFLKKTDKSLKDLEIKIKECIDDLSKLEKENSTSIDKTADTFGRLLSIVGSYGLDGINERIAKEACYHLGKWIYVIDAYDDYYDDIKKKSYNVLVNNYGTDLNEDRISNIKCALILELEQMAKSIELIDFTEKSDVERIIKNIIYLGMPSEFERITKNEKRQKQRAKILKKHTEVQNEQSI